MIQIERIGSKNVKQKAVGTQGTAWHRICMLKSRPLLSAVLADSEQKEEAKQNEGDVIFKTLGLQILEYA